MAQTEQLKFLIEDCEEEIMLSEEGIKNTKRYLISDPNNEELKETLEITFDSDFINNESLVNLVLESLGGD